MNTEKIDNSITKLCKKVRSLDIEAVLLSPSFAIEAVSPSAAYALGINANPNQKQSYNHTKASKKEYLALSIECIRKITMLDERLGNSCIITLSHRIGSCPALVTRCHLGRILILLLPECALLTHCSERETVERRLKRIAASIIAELLAPESEANTLESKDFANSIPKDIFDEASLKFGSNFRSKSEFAVYYCLHMNKQHFAKQISRGKITKIVRRIFEISDQLMLQNKPRFGKASSYMSPERFLLIVTEAVLIAARCHNISVSDDDVPAIIRFEEFEDCLELTVSLKKTSSALSRSAKLSEKLLLVFGAKVSLNEHTSTNELKITISYDQDYYFEIRRNISLSAFNIALSHLKKSYAPSTAKAQEL